MDCRRSVWAALCLAGGAVGCSHTNPGVPVLPPQVATTGPVTPPPGAVIKKEVDLPKRPPRPATCVAKANYHAAEAEALTPGSADADNQRNLARVAYQQ